MKGYDNIQVEIPGCPWIARIICPDEKKTATNTAAAPGANVDLLVSAEQIKNLGISLGPNQGGE